MPKNFAASVLDRAVAQVPVSVELKPGEALYRSVRAGLMLRGFTFNRFCNEHGIERTWASQVLLGNSNGPKARALRKRLIEAASL